MGVQPDWDRRSGSHSRECICVSPAIRWRSWSPGSLYGVCAPLDVPTQGRDSVPRRGWRGIGSFWGVRPATLRRWHTKSGKRGSRLIPAASSGSLGETLTAPERSRAESIGQNDRPHCSKGERASLTLGEVARIMGEAVKDMSYRSTPVGLEVGHIIRWFRNTSGAVFLAGGFVKVGGSSQPWAGWASRSAAASGSQVSRG